MIHLVKLDGRVGCDRRILCFVSVLEAAKRGRCIRRCDLLGGERFPMNLIKGVLP